MPTKIFQILIVDFNVIDQLPIRYYTFVKYQRTDGNTVEQYTIIQL